MKSLKNTRILLIATLTAGLLAGGAIGSRLTFVRTASAQAPGATPLQIPDPVKLSTTFSQLAKQLEPSVVQVTSIIEPKKASPRSRRNLMPQDPDDLFRRFFGQDPFGGGDEDSPMPRRQFRSEGTGSGFIVSDKGFILTNNHVVEDASKITVSLHDDPKEYRAKVIGTDPELDLAVIKIEPDRPLVPVKIGNSDGVQVGDWAVAIGSPFGLEATVTAGIISGLGRNLNTPGHQLQRFLQTDAAINPGNSGGPLLNIRGEVIGVNTMIATRSGASEGVGFALPMNMAVNAYNQIIKTGKVSRGAIGILFQPNENTDLLKVYGGANAKGVFVREVTPGKAADKAGVKAGDIITSFGGKPVKDGDQLVNLVSETPVGTRVPITLLRDGKPMTLNIEVADRQSIVAGNTGPGSPDESSDEKGQPSVKLGVSVRGLRTNERESMNLGDKSGVLVTDVDQGSFAEDIGVQPGDIINEINRQPVNTVDDVKRIAQTLKPGSPVAFRVLRSSRVRTQQGTPREWTALFLAGTLSSEQ